MALDGIMDISYDWAETLVKTADIFCAQQSTVSLHFLKQIDSFNICDSCKLRLRGILKVKRSQLPSNIQQVVYSKSL